MKLTICTYNIVLRRLDEPPAAAVPRADQVTYTECHTNQPNWSVSAHHWQSGRRITQHPNKQVSPIQSNPIQSEPPGSFGGGADPEEWKRTALHSAIVRTDSGVWEHKEARGMAWAWYFPMDRCRTTDLGMGNSICSVRRGSFCFGSGAGDCMYVHTA